MAPARLPTDTRILLELEGVAAGFLLALEGDEPSVAVVAEHLDADQVVRKNIVAIGIRPLRLSFGAQMGTPVYQWMADWFQRLNRAKRGAIVFADRRLREARRIEFDDAHITRVEFPAMDAAQGAPGVFALTLLPGAVRTSVAGAGTRLSPVAAAGAKGWLSSNFRLNVDGLQTAAVGRIDVIVVEQTVSRDSPREPAAFGPLRIPDLSLWLPETRAAEWLAWFDDFVMAGNNTQAGERGGSLEMLSADLRTALFTLTLSHLGIVRIDRHRPADATAAGAVSRVSARLYCEEMAFHAAP